MREKPTTKGKNMTTAKTMDRPTVRTISDEAEKALQAVAKKFGLELKRKSGRFSSTSLTTKFEFSIKGQSPQVTEFKKFASLVGLKETDFGKTFTSQGDTFTISGLNLRAKMYPVLAVSSRNGKTYKFNRNDVKLYLSR